jgi:hypothetical protein
MDHCTDVLAWNALAAALIADFPRLAPADRNMARQVFLDPVAREIHADWDRAARETVGILRIAAGRWPHEHELVQLVGELSLGSEAFRRLWASHHVHEKTHGAKRLRHPELGLIALTYETLAVPDSDHLVMVIFTAEPGSEDADKLRMLREGAITGA